MAVKSMAAIQKRRPDLSAWLFGLAAVYCLSHIGPPFWKTEVKYLITAGDLSDLAMPFIMLGIIYFLVHRMWRLSSSSGPAKAAHGYLGVVIIGAILFVEGHGIHLSANVIARHLVSQIGSPVYAATYFFDETLGHILWDGGIIIITIGLFGLGLTAPAMAMERPRPVFLVAGALLFGFTYFCNAIEGQTVVFTFPTAVLMPPLIWVVTKTRHIRPASHPIGLFVVFAYGTAVILFVIWGVWHKGFPEFSDLGWI